jgi:PleD family two-component response regulator
MIFSFFNIRAKKVKYLRVQILSRSENYRLLKRSSRRRILLIDDEPDVTLTLKTVLENDGYEVDMFNDPIMALEHFKKVTCLSL